MESPIKFTKPGAGIIFDNPDVEIILNSVITAHKIRVSTEGEEDSPLTQSDYYRLLKEAKSIIEENNVSCNEDDERRMKDVLVLAMGG